MSWIKRALHNSWIGLVATIVVLVGSVIYEYQYGPLYGEWGWRQISLGLLVLLIMLLSGIVALLRQPNPYSRTNPLYSLDDVPPDRNLESGGGGWILQAVPPAVAIVLLLVLIFTY